MDSDLPQAKVLNMTHKALDAVAFCELSDLITYKMPLLICHKQANLTFLQTQQACSLCMSFALFPLTRKLFPQICMWQYFLKSFLSRNFSIMF